MLNEFLGVFTNVCLLLWMQVFNRLIQKLITLGNSGNPVFFYYMVALGFYIQWYVQQCVRTPSVAHMQQTTSMDTSQWQKPLYSKYIGILQVT